MEGEAKILWGCVGRRRIEKEGAGQDEGLTKQRTRERKNGGMYGDMTENQNMEENTEGGTTIKQEKKHR